MIIAILRATVFVILLVSFACGIQWLLWRNLPRLKHIALLAFMVWLVLLLTVVIPCNAAELPADVVYRQVATKALDGRFGPLEPWQRQGYEKLLRLCSSATNNRKGITRKMAWITVYNEHDKGCNRWTASGREVSHRVAAMIDKPWGTWVLVDLPEGYQLRQVFDTGSRRNIWRAQNPPRDRHGRLVRRPAETWIDLYYSPAAMKTLKNGRDQSWVRPIFVF